MTAKQAQERLNYFNGQRLEATDYRVEQAYHIAVRRELNRSLYTSGIAKGLEVTKKSAHTVLISPGLALDYWGREIILAEALELTVGGMISTTPGEVFGNYLVIEYGEERSSPMHEQCPSKSGGNAGLNWSGPARIIAKPLIYVQDSWPSETSGKLVLAQIELKQGCEVVKAHVGMRKYIAASKPPKARPLSLEGEKDIDKDNSKVLHFHIINGYPDRVLLYLRAAKFSTLYYSEIGSHNHSLDIELKEEPGKEAHDHHLDGLRTDEYRDHDHIITADLNNPKPEHAGIEMDPSEGRFNLNEKIGLQVSMNGRHSHAIQAGGVTQKGGEIKPHSHIFTKKTVGFFGALSARPGPAHEYIDSLQIIFDGSQDITPDVLTYLQGQPGQATFWKTLGDGTFSHKLVAEGTTRDSLPIDLVQFGLDLSPGPHSLTFKVNKGGGKIHYNLYVE